MSDRRQWHVLLIGGASGVGKTHVSYRIAQHFGVGITPIDDFQVILERMTTPEQQPEMHFFQQHQDEWHRMDDEQKLGHSIRYGEAMSVPLELVIANHLDGGSPIVLEGDFILPRLVVQPAYEGIPAAGRVRGIFIYEPDEEQIGRNFLAREGDAQPIRARAGWHHSEWLRREATRLGVPTLAARPWDTEFERALALIDAPS